MNVSVPHPKVVAHPSSSYGGFSAGSRIEAEKPFEEIKIGSETFMVTPSFKNYLGQSLYNKKSTVEQWSLEGRIYNLPHGDRQKAFYGLGLKPEDF